MSQLLVNAIGVFAALCSMVSFVPQVIKIWRERDASSVSLRMYVVTVLGFILWTAYGVLLKSWPLIGSNLISLALSAAILALKLRFGEGEQAAAAATQAR
jgi:MtN3 and saliva related transmembrane protein